MIVSESGQVQVSKNAQNCKPNKSQLVTQGGAAHYFEIKAEELQVFMSVWISHIFSLGIVSFSLCTVQATFTLQKSGGHGMQFYQWVLLWWTDSPLNEVVTFLSPWPTGVCHGGFAVFVRKPHMIFAVSLAQSTLLVVGCMWVHLSYLVHILVMLYENSK